MLKPYDPCEEYNKQRFSWRQMRDCIAGSNRIKEANIAYLPMPSAMDLVPAKADSGQNIYTNNSKDFAKYYLPFYHPNPAYMAYLQRARFPDITANALRGIIGIATKYDCEIELPSSMAYLEEEANSSGLGLADLYIETVSEVLQVGKQILIADFDEEGSWYVVTYTAESNINWEYVMIQGQPVITMLALKDDLESDECKIYCFNDEGFVVIQHWEKDSLIQEVPLSYKGKQLTRIPAVCIGSVSNTPDPDVIPLLGISDIAISIYQENADLRQGHYLTCNPTLFIYGVGEKETPSVIGSSVIVGIKNPAAKAEYPATDTSAFEHVRNYIKDLYQEAVTYGAAFLANPNSRESGDALSIKNASRGANLVHMINMISEGYERLLGIIAEVQGESVMPEFEGNTDFAEMNLTAQDIAALVSSWVQGAIDHDTLLNNLREAGYVDADRTNEQIKAAIEEAKPVIDPMTVDGLAGGDNGQESESAG